jgi:hypothetical protein
MMLVRHILSSVEAALISTVGCIWISLDLILFSIPTYNHTLFGDYPDPDRPGHLKGVSVQLPELQLKIAAATVLGLLAATIWFRRMRGPRPYGPRER